MEMQVSRAEIQIHLEGLSVHVCNSKNISYKLTDTRITVGREKILLIGNCDSVVATNAKTL